MSCNRLIPLDTAASCSVNQTPNETGSHCLSGLRWLASTVASCSMMMSRTEGGGCDGGRGWRCWIHRVQRIDVQWVCFLLWLYKRVCIDRWRERDIKWRHIVVKCGFPFSAFVFEPRRHQGSRSDHRTCWINHELSDRSKKNIYPPTEELKQGEKKKKNTSSSRSCVYLLILSLSFLSLSHTHRYLLALSLHACQSTLHSPLLAHFCWSSSSAADCYRGEWQLKCEPACEVTGEPVHVNKTWHGLN